MKKGCLFAVGVGSGDPLDMTLKAKQVLEKSSAVIVPVKCDGDTSAAYNIASSGADISDKEIIEIVFPMKHVPDYRKYLNDKKLQPVFEHLDKGHDVSVITLGDVSVYSTAAYLRDYIEKKGYETYVVAGVSSFSAAAAKAKITLCENKESFSVVPGVSDESELRKKLDDFDTVVIMKAGSIINWLIPFLEENGMYDNAVMFCNINMKDEYTGPLVYDRNSYFTTVIIKNSPK